MKEVTLSKIIGKTGVFIDGDWVESKDQEPNGDVRLIQLADIGDGVFINKSNRFLTSEKAKDLKCTFLKQGDLLIARMPDPLGRSCIFPGINMPCVTVVDICIVRPDANIADSEWLKFLINSYDFRNKINKYITGTTRQRISRGNLEKLSFGLPPLHDQLHIANLLSKAENLISQRKQSIALLDEFLKSTFLEMFGDFKEMSTSKLDFLGDNISYLTSGSRGWAQYYSESGAKFLRIQNIGGGIIRMDNLIHVNPPDSAEADRTRVKEGDLLISITADLGRTSVIPKDFGEAYINQHLALIRLNKNINPIYAAYFYNMPFGNNAIQKKNRAAVKAGLNFNDIKSFPISIPSMARQTQFAQIVEKNETIKTYYQSSLQELENLYGSLSQRAFRGELTLNKAEEQVLMAAEPEAGYQSHCKK